MKKILIIVINFIIIVNLFSKDITRYGFSYWLPDDIISDSIDYTDNERWIIDSNKNQSLFIIHLPMTKYTDNGYISLNATQSLVYLLENGFANYFSDFILSEVKNNSNNLLNKMKIEGKAKYYKDSKIGDRNEPFLVNIFGVFQEQKDKEIKTFGIIIICDNKNTKDYKKTIDRILNSLKFNN